MPFTLVREPGSERCSKCAALLDRGEVKAVQPAIYTLTDRASSWRLCLNHAAAASHAHKIPPFYQPPQGASPCVQSPPTPSTPATK